MGHTPLICATGVSRPGAWGSPTADPDVDSSCYQAASRPAPHMGLNWPLKADGPLRNTPSSPSQALQEFRERAARGLE